MKTFKAFNLLQPG